MDKKNFKLAIAQLNTKYCDIKSNLEKHVRYISDAANNDAEIILFPELSLTSYHRYFTDEYLFDYNDTIFDIFKRTSIEKKIIIVYGIPLKIKSKVFIASVVQFPNGDKEIYCKNNLHEGEEVFFDEGNGLTLINIGQEKIFFGICYDIEIEEHIKKAVELNATIYASSIFYSENGIKGLKNKLKYYVDKYKIDIAISNYVGKVWEQDAGGTSMYWDKNGDCIGSCDKFKESILFCSKAEDNWSTETKILNYD